MKKRILLVLLMLCLVFWTLTGVCASNTSDIALQTIRTLKIMNGDENGNLNLEQPVTRAQFVTMMTSASVYKDSVNGAGNGYSLFKDVKSGHWACEYIYLALNQGWVVGYTDGTFRPDNTITLEEACSALLKLLGYDSSSLSGTYPTAQLTKANSLGLLDDVTASRGEALTRYECVILFYNLLTCQTANGQSYGVTLGYAVTDGEIDYTSVTLKNLKGPYIVQDTTELSFVPEKVYRDGTLSNNASLNTSQVYYYNEALKTLWIYTEKVTGTVTALSPNSQSPSSVTISGKTYDVSSSDISYKLSSINGVTVGSRVTLLLGMDSTVADVICYGETDYTATASDNLKGPFVSDGAVNLPFDSAVVYRNGELSSLESVNKYDVYYYNKNMKTVWVYSDKVTGKITALSPSALSPSSVTVFGKTYSISEYDAKYKLSALAGTSVGDTVTLLLGIEGSVVEVLTDSEVNMTYYGVIQSSAKALSEEESATVSTNLTVFCTDGIERTFTLDKSTSYTVGRLVCVNISDNTVTVNTLNEKSMKGDVNKTATKFGDLSFAENIEILDSSDEGDAVNISADRLAGAELKKTDVRYYVLNSYGEISHLILDDVTGDIWSYGYLTSLADSRDIPGSNNLSSTVTYTYLINGKTSTAVTKGLHYPVYVGGLAVRYNSDGSIKKMMNTTSVKLTYIGTSTAEADNKIFEISDKVQVYLMQNGVYYQTDISKINAENYTLTGYYDDFGNTNGRQIRVIIATAKQ